MIRRLSWSQLTKWEHCPFDWYAAYVLKLTKWEPKIYFQVGTAAHSAVELALKYWEGVRKTVPEMVEAFRDGLKKEGITDPDTLQYHVMLAQPYLQAWYAHFINKEIHIEHLEQRILHNNFVGVVDCVCLIDNQRYIIDWKTSSRPYSQKRADTDAQVTAYLMLTGADPVTTRVAYGVMVKGMGKFQFLESSRTQDDIEVLQIRIDSMRAVINTYRLVAPEKKIGKHCENCDIYKMGKCEGEDDF